MDRWVGKVAVVTGASAGIGKALVIDLVKAGVIVCGLARRKENIDDIAKLVDGEKGELHAYKCDITSEESVKQVFNEIEIKFGRVNILVNNAGATANSTILGETSNIANSDHSVWLSESKSVNLTCGGKSWVGKVAVVTGASAGIGKALVIDLVKAGVIVCGLARRKENIDDIAKLVDGEKGELHAYKCDITSEESVKQVFNEIEIKFGRVNILVNNAGATANSTILGETSNMDLLSRVIDTNIYGVLYCTRAAFDILDKTKEDGHIINIGSVVGHSIPYIPSVKRSVYPASKHALRAIHEVLRQELIPNHKNVKVSMVSPGLVRTEFHSAAGLKMNYDICSLNPEDVSSACLYVLGTPPHVQVHDMIIKPVGEPF